MRVQRTKGRGGPWWPTGATLAAMAWFVVAPPAHAVNPGERLEDPALEARARDLSKELRCLVCQNQDIDSSDADMAADLRILVRERLVAGDSNAEVLSYLTARYGAFVRLRPPVNAYTLGLWGLPFLVVLVAGGAAILYLRARRQAGTGDAATLTRDEEETLARLLKENETR